jgi:hypothetical protein
MTAGTTTAPIVGDLRPPRCLMAADLRAGYLIGRRPGMLPPSLTSTGLSPWR